MSIEKVRDYLRPLGREGDILEFPVSSATVELAAQAVGVIPARIAKTLSFLVEGRAVLVVAAGDAKIDNAKYKAKFAAKAKMLSPQEAEASAKEIISYSQNEVRRKVRGVQKKYLLIVALVLAVAALIGGVLLWRSGRLFILDEVVSPDGTCRTTVYSKRLNGSSFSFEDEISVITEQEDGLQWRVIYGDCVYRGVWWSPDSRKYVLALDDGDESRLTLSWLDRNSSSNLNAYLSMGVETTELRKYGYSTPDGWPEIEYQFLQWGTDSASMLVYYVFEDSVGEDHSGYFWYNCETGAVDGILEMDSR